MRKLIDGIPETVPSGFRSFIYQTFLRKSAYNHELQQQIPPLWGLCQRTPYQVRFVLCSADQELLLHVEEIREDIPTKSAIYKKPKKQTKFVSNLDLRSNIPWIWFDFSNPIPIKTRSDKIAPVRNSSCAPLPPRSVTPVAAGVKPSAWALQMAQIRGEKRRRGSPLP